MNNNLGVSPSLSVGGRAIRHSLHSRYRSVTFKQHLLSLTREGKKKKSKSAFIQTLFPMGNREDETPKAQTFNFIPNVKIIKILYSNC